MSLDETKVFFVLGLPSNLIHHYEMNTWPMKPRQSQVTCSVRQSRVALGHFEFFKYVFNPEISSKVENSGSNLPELYEVNTQELHILASKIQNTLI